MRTLKTFRQANVLLMGVLSIAVTLLAFVAAPRHDDTPSLPFASDLHAAKAGVFSGDGCRADVRGGSCCTSLHCLSGIASNNSTPELQRQIPVSMADLERNLAFQTWGRLERPPKA